MTQPLSSNSRSYVRLLLGILACACSTEPNPGPDSCPANEALCAGACTDTSADPANCGMCGRACGATETCAAGSCVVLSGSGGTGGPGSGGTGVSSGGAGGGPTGGSNGSGGSGGSGGQQPPAPPFTNRYDGARATTESFDLGWQFNLGDAAGAEDPTFDDSSWDPVDVPHDWSITLPYNQSSQAGAGGGYLDGGVGWYRKTFTLPSQSSDERWLVQFDGVYMDSTVWLNGDEVCVRPYGFTSFECDLTESAVFGGENVLAVRVNNQLPSSRWYSGSGIYRHVWLKTVDPVHVAYLGTKVATPEVSATSATVSAVITIENEALAAQEVSVSLSVRDADGAEVVAGSPEPVVVDAGGTAEVSHSLTVQSPALWAPAAPNLYSLVTTVSVADTPVDVYTTPFGIRSFEFDANEGFLLNGQHLKINGVCLHHDLGALGAAVNERALERRLELLKEMGTNAIRTSHNPPAPELLDLTDRMGFLVMDEAFDMWYGAKTAHDYARFFDEWAETDIRDMVKRDRNHPSVIIWSIGNEVPQAGDQAVAQDLIDAVRLEDDTRVVGQAFAQFAYDEGTAGLEDVVGLNYNPGIYDSQHAEHPTWKFFGSETSSAIRSRGIYNNQNTQCSSYDDAVVGWGQKAEDSWRDVNTRDFIAGEFIWTGVDYIGEPTPYEWPAKSSYFGAIDTANLPKDIFYFYQSRWNYDGPTMVHIVPMNWTNWSPGQSVRVLVYSNADSVELSLNGSSLGSKDVDPTEGHLEWSVPFAAGVLEATATKAGAVAATDTVQTAGSADSLVLSVDRNSIRADGRDLAFVEISVTDAEGVVVPNASNSIALSISGPGEIAGVDNGNAINHEPYQGTTISAFSGKAVAIVRSTTSGGEITLSATSDGLTESAITISTAGE